MEIIVEKSIGYYLKRSKETNGNRNNSNHETLIYPFTALCDNRSLVLFVFWSFLFGASAHGKQNVVPQLDFAFFCVFFVVVVFVFFILKTMQSTRFSYGIEVINILFAVKWNQH